MEKAVKYLGVVLDTGLSFGEHLRRATAGARQIAVELDRLMPNVGGPSMSKKKLLTSVVNSKLLYASPIWASKIRDVAKSR